VASPSPAVRPEPPVQPSHRSSLTTLGEGPRGRRR
jgi:hypothetical protein